jgi:hypothetical protein
MTSQSSNLPALCHGTPEIEVMAKYASDSKLFPGISTPQAAFTLMMLCQADGLHPMTALRRFHLINGRPTMRADAMLAGFQAQDGKVRWLERTDEAVEAEFSHPAGGTISVRWDMNQARRAGLATKDIWKQYPRQMMTARVISEGVRTILPGVVTGIYTPEEAQDMEPAAPPIEVTGRVVEAEPASLALPASEPWSDFIGRIALDANDDWASRLADAGVAKEDRKPLLDVHTLTNAVATRAVAKGLIPEASVSQKGKPGTWDAERARSAVAGLFKKKPKGVTAAVSACVDEIRLKAVDELGKDEEGLGHDPEEESQEVAVEVEEALSS